jgi:hypothetical protein
MRRVLLIETLLFAALWLAGWLLWVPRIQERVQQEALRALQEANDMRDVQVSVSGRTALLTGTVPSEAAATRAVEIVSAGSLLSGSIKSDLDARPPPAGWFLLGLAGERIYLTGAVSSSEESREVLEETRRQHEKPGVRVIVSVQVDADRFSLPDSLHRTAKAIPTARSGLRTNQGALAFARSGEGWKLLPTDAESAVMRAIPTPQADTKETAALVSPIVKAVKEYDMAQLAAKTERERLASLPPPFLILMMEDDAWLLRGEVGSAEAKSEMLASILGQHTDKRVLDEIRVSAQRNPFADLRVLTSSLDDLPETAGESTAHVGLPGHGWLRCDLSEPEPAAIIQQKTTAADAALVVKDMLAARREIETVRAAEADDLPAFLTLILLPDRVIICGELPDEASRSQTLAAARSAYPGLILTQDIRLNVRGAPARGLQHTLRALPPARTIPPEGLLAFATPGEIWSQRSASEKLLTTEGVAASGLIPGNALTQRAIDTLRPGLPVLRAHLENQKQTRRRS